MRNKGIFYFFTFAKIALPVFFVSWSIPAIVAIAAIMDTNCTYSVPEVDASCSMTGVTIAKDANAPIITEAAIFLGSGGFVDCIQPSVLFRPTPTITIIIDSTIGFRPKMSSMK